LSPKPAEQNALTQGCRRDLLFDYSPAAAAAAAAAAAGSGSKAVSKVRLLTVKAAGNWVAWSAVTLTMCPLAS
jgi:hypothetical protein